MKKTRMIILITCLLIVPVLAQAQAGNFFEDLFGKGNREINAGSLSVSQMEMIPNSPRYGQPVAFRAIVENNSRQDVIIQLAVVDRDRVITQLNDVYLRPGKNLINFPDTSVQFSHEEQRCFNIQTDIDHRWVPITMATAFCSESSENSKNNRSIELTVEGLRMTPDPVSSDQAVSFVVRLRNDGKKIKGNIRIQDSDQVLVQTDKVHIPRGVTDFRLPSSRYAFQHMDSCFTVLVDVDRTSHQIDTSEEYCATPTAWTLRTRNKGHKEDRNLNWDSDRETRRGN